MPYRIVEQWVEPRLLFSFRQAINEEYYFYESYKDLDANSPYTYWYDLVDREITSDLDEATYIVNSATCFDIRAVLPNVSGQDMWDKVRSLLESGYLSIENGVLKKT